MLDSAVMAQLRELFSGLKSQYTLRAKIRPDHPKRGEMVDLITSFAESSPQIVCHIEPDEAIELTISKDGEPSRVSFRAIPSGHEFTSLILAILNLDGKGRNLPDDFTSGRIRSLSGPIKLTTYMSLSCTNCPDVVQALNVMAILSDGISHEAVDGSLYEAEVKRLNVQSVPMVFADGRLLHVGRGGIADILAKLEAKYGGEIAATPVVRGYDVTVAGGGPAGATAALYLARKGLRVALVAQRIGGQVNETSAIENIPSVITTLGPTLSADLKSHLLQYPTIELLENRIIESADFSVDGVKRLQIKGGEVVESQQLIIATGAQWRRLGVNGEAEYIGRGVAFCPHCDGPIFRGREVAVIGGGNSGVEAAIDLSGICSKVILLEFMESLKADEVLQRKLRTLSNVLIHTNTQTTQIIGDGEKVVAIEIRDRESGEQKQVELSGVFIQIGLVANSQLFHNQLNVNRTGEIEVDRNGRTSAQGVYAAGDVTDVSYKQIVISMGEGAKAALALFDDGMRG
ncbi:MAG: alkyl hydroperoxide reductase subunit F [Rikenellaceae bacterium]